MNFDFSQIPVPFSMRPGLRRLDASSPQLTALRPNSRLAAEKRAVFEAGVSRHVVAGFDPNPALRAIAERFRSESARSLGAEEAPELAFEEDLAVLDGETGTLPWLCVCVPSHWAPGTSWGWISARCTSRLRTTRR